jgi:hypothetical protein
MHPFSLLSTYNPVDAEVILHIHVFSTSCPMMNTTVESR